MRDELFYQRLFKSWYSILKPVVYSNRFDGIIDKVTKAYSKSGLVITPTRSSIFKPFQKCNYNNLKVVIIGKYPYVKDSTGLAFANNEDAMPISTELQTIIDSIERDYCDGLLLEPDFTLERWANQGVLLWNAIPMIKKKNIDEYEDLWKPFTAKLVEYISSKNNKVVFCFFGKNVHGLTKFVKSSNYIKVDYPYQDRLNNIEWNFSFNQIDKIVYKNFLTKINWQ